MMRARIQLWLAITLVAPLASAQMAHLPDVERGLEGVMPVTGVADVRELLEGRVALFFFLPADCPACDIVADWADLYTPTDIEVVFVTRASGRSLDAWLAAHPTLNVLFDSRDELAFLLGVTAVPTVFMLDEGAVVNAAYWPFADDMPGLAATLEVFRAGGFKSHEAALDELRQVDAEAILLIAGNNQTRPLSSLGPGVYIVCTPKCAVCAEEAWFLRDLLASGAELPDIRIVLLVESQEEAAAANPWSETPFPVEYALFDAAGPLHTGKTPTHFALDAAGRVTWAQIGFAPVLDEVLTGLHDQGL